MKPIYFRINSFLLILPAIYTAFFPGKIVLITVISALPILVMLLLNSNRLKINELDGINIIKFYILSNALIFIRGVFDYQSSKDFIFLFGSLLFTMLMMPLYMFIVNKINFLPILKSIVWIAIPLSLITFFKIPTPAQMSYQHNISIVYYLIFLIPFVNKKWKFIILGLAISGLVYDITRRSYLINLCISSVILVIYLFSSSKTFIKNSKILYNVFIISPILFFILGITGVFNIFLVGDKIDAFYLKKGESSRNILLDSRSGIYTDVLKDLNKKDALLLGLGGNGKTKTSLINVAWADYDVIYKDGRRSSESGMLNYIQWGGILSAGLYFILLSYASFHAVFKSKNHFLIMIGLFLAFKVGYSFVEDILDFQLATFYEFFIIGVCFNYHIRNLNNSQLKYIIQRVFN